MLESASFALAVVYYSEAVKKLHRRFPQIQLRRFRRLLAHAQKHSPYLRQKYRGIDPRQAQLADVPVITKAEMMANFDCVVTDRRIRLVDVEKFVADRANVGRYLLNKYPVLHTSGSQGQPALLVQD